MNKKLNLLCTFVLAILVLVSLASAASTFSVNKGTLVFSSSGSQTFTIENANVSELLDVSLTPSPFKITYDGQEVEFGFTGDLKDINGSSTITVAPLTPIDFSRIKLGDSFSKVLTLTDDSNISETTALTVRIEDSDFCEFEDNGNLNIDIDDINARGYADEDDEWYPLDMIEIDVDVENDGNDDIKNIEIEWVLLTKDGKEIMDGDLNDFNLKDGKDDTLTISFQLDPDDLEEGEEDYVFYVRATGEDDEFDKNETCVSDSADIKIILESDFAIIDTETLDIPDTVSCGTSFQIRADVWNIGEDDQDEVKVRITNSELKIDEYFEVGDIDALDKEELVATIDIPANADEKAYPFTFRVLDEDNDLYENDNDDASEFSETIQLSSCGSTSGVSGAGLSISATLQSDAMAGEQMIVKATLTNNGDESGVYSAFVSGNEGWSSLDKIQPQSLVLDAGETDEVLIYLDVDSDASGEQTFKLKVVYGSESKEQTVSVNIEGTGSGGALTGNAIGVNIRENWFIWTIVLVNVILIVLIIVVATRIARS
ncbi:MAG: putative S-layer protein [archaeon]